MSLLEIKGLETEFQTEQGVVKALRGINYTVDRGEVLGIVGESGSGKSVGMLSLMGLLAPNGTVTAGEMIFDGEDISPIKYKTKKEKKEYEKKMNQIRVEGNKIHAGAGALLSKIAAAALADSLTGFEFAAGIPGTLGGAVRMNAGAYGGEMKQVLESVAVMTADGEFLTIPVEEMGLAYRTSVVEQKNYIVLEAVISLEKGNPEKIKEVMDDLKEKRVTKQPLEYASAGSTFKRPEGYFAGKLIEDAGLRGFRVGDAQVSEKHCGFVINRGNASAAEVMELMRQVEDKVEENSGVRLEAEVRRIGEF